MSHKYRTAGSLEPPDQRVTRKAFGQIGDSPETFNNLDREAPTPPHPEPSAEDMLRPCGPAQASQPVDRRTSIRSATVRDLPGSFGHNYRAFRARICCSSWPSGTHSNP